MFTHTHNLYMHMHTRCIMRTHNVCVYIHTRCIYTQCVYTHNGYVFAYNKYTHNVCCVYIPSPSTLLASLPLPSLCKRYIYVTYIQHTLCVYTHTRTHAHTHTHTRCAYIHTQTHTEFVRERRVPTALHCTACRETRHAHTAPSIELAHINGSCLQRAGNLALGTCLVQLRGAGGVTDLPQVC